MGQPFLALITPLTGAPDQGLPPSSPGSPSHPIYHPGHPDHGRPSHPISGGGYPDQGLPGNGGGRPSHPIAGYPDQGLPGGQPPGYWGGMNPHPDQGLPGQSGGYPSHPIHIPGVPDQGLPEGEPIEPGEITPPMVPPEHADDLVVGVRQPNSTEWTFTAYDVAPDQGQPAPSPHGR